MKVNVEPENESGGTCTGGWTLWSLIKQNHARSRSYVFSRFHVSENSRDSEEPAAAMLF